MISRRALLASAAAAIGGVIARPAAGQSGDVTWTNKHGNVTAHPSRIVTVWNRPAAVSGAEPWRAGLDRLKETVRRAEGRGARVRALGSGWSLSEVAVTDGWQIDTKPLNFIRVGLDAESICAAGEARERLVLAQCGATVRELNRALEARGLSLPTSGGADGQTIAGAIATGTHGSAVRVGSMQDFIVGVHLVGENGDEHWIERRSDPIVSEAFAGGVGATLHRDDRLFDAVLVSFGSFGIVHAVLLRAEPIYVLERYRVARAWKMVRRAIGSLDMRGLDLPRGDLLPFYFEILLNPHGLGNGDDGALVTAMYKLPWEPTEDEPVGIVEASASADALGIIGTLADVLPVGATSIASMQFRQLFPQWHGDRRTHGQAFGETNIAGPSLSMELGVALADALATVELLRDLAQELSFVGAFGLRYVRRSRALLAHTRFEPTCAIELPSVGSARTVAFYEAAVDGIERAGIPFTMHWGQWTALTPERVHTMWGSAVDAWLTARRSLLSPAGRRTFANEFLERLGLAN